MFQVVTFFDVDRARVVLVGNHHGSKQAFAALLGLPNYCTIRAWLSRGQVPNWAAAAIEVLMSLTAHQLAELKERRCELGS